VQAFDLRIDFAVENLTIVYPCNLLIGVVAYSREPSPQLPRTLREHLHFEALPEFDALGWYSRHTPAVSAASVPVDAPPLTRQGARAEHVALFPYTVRSMQLAVYVLPVGSFPQWHQLDITTAFATAGAFPSDRVLLTRVEGEAPSVKVVE
jgi:hypothetical protein